MPLRMVRPPCGHEQSFEADQVLTVVTVGVNKTRVPSPLPQKQSMPRSSSQPAPGSKNVAFDLGSEGSRMSSPDARRHRRRGETTRGYEAEDESESTLDGRDKRYPTHHPISETESDPERSAGHTKHRRRHPGNDRSNADHRQHRPRRSSKRQPAARDGGRASPAGSDTTIVLPDRFDKEGRKKPERGDDAMADILEDLIAGKGPGGKYFKKIFGTTDDDDDESGRRRRR